MVLRLLFHHGSLGPCEAPSSLVSCRSTGERLVDDAFDHPGRTGLIVHAFGDTIIVAKIKFRKVAVQMLLADVMVSANNAALQDREMVLNGVGVPDLGADILVGAVIDGLMGQFKAFGYWLKDLDLVGHLDVELLPAGVALIEALASGLACILFTRSFSPQ